ncbi:MAG: hypothetical protein MPI95_05365 [Nitrosopumilus sp.]|nr:hypothetical protein [Nitrosopumilus sp.]MDA7941596.1 hypothetical protein [Nitrosopumilus sp.]MDA7943856.1 hypothetical protein [Nitrosopumilus sp.]MDA7945234.1 hypothetical protein [Nitrosopumilus sp.]MDA7953170.1 hypothetical protein [Nitrosopumilus sp.]
MEEGKKHKGWTDGIGWTAEELVWTEADTEWMKAAKARSKSSRPVTAAELRALHESLKY